MPSTAAPGEAMNRSRGAASRLHDQIDRTVAKAASVDAAIKSLCALLDVDFITYHMALHGVESVEKPYVRTNYPDAWVGRYLLMNYIDVDPVAQAGFKSSVPRNWSDLDWSSPQTKAFAADAAAHGLGGCGFLVPVLDERHRRAMVNFCSRAEESVWRKHVQKHRQVYVHTAHALHDRVIVEHFGHQDGTPRLTSREIECLALAARGFDAPRVARHLGLSEHTVRDYFKAARWKLGCTTLAQSVHKATLLRLIDAEEGSKD